MELPDFVITEEFSKAVHSSSQTIRKNYCEKGHCYGIVPVKVGGRLLWRASDIAKLLNTGQENPEVFVVDEAGLQKSTA
jgi:hypothetical protein